MRTNPIRNLLAPSILAVALLFAGCNKAQTRTDAQVASDIQSKISSDQAIQNKQVSVQAANGVVTLSGSVSSETERTAVASDAATVNGVRTVVNNLSVQSADNSAQPAPPPQADTNSQPAASQPASQPATPTKGVNARKPSAAVQHNGRQAAQNGSQADMMAQQQQPAPESSQYAQNVPPPPPAAPMPPPPPPKVTVPDGTSLSIRMLDTLDSETANPGDTFRATLNSPVQVDGKTVIPSDADVFGRVVDVHAAGRFKGSGLLTIEITKIAYNGHFYPIHSNQWSKQTESRGKGTAEKVGGGAALGAIIGAIAGGGKGAGIGAAVGAGAGGVTQAAIKAAQIKLGPESLLTFHLAQPVTVQPSNRNERNAGRQSVE